MSEDKQKNGPLHRNKDKDSFPPVSRDDSNEAMGEQIGPYKLLSVLGEGGFAIVYLAEQKRPVRRMVALKVIKPGMDSKQVIARFEAEKQALALLDHPNIARVFDAGTAENGRPYFVMEYIKGDPVTKHCDHNKLTIEDRLRLFLQICEAVRHAHQKAIIHRDIKPSNILVYGQGEKVLPKIIDFGVAKALSQPLTERTLFTEQGQLIGTPEYMSPEQAEMTNQDIDTRADIYSLGVLLYVLLTGILPFDPQTLRKAGIDHIRHMIREEEPGIPSTRLSTISSEESTKLAQQRQTDVRSLKHELRGDLDWITMKAMEKDRNRRYETVQALAEDIQLHMDHEPVRAVPPSTIYRLRKFLRKHRYKLTIAAMVAVLFASIVVIFLLYEYQSVANKRADRVQAEADRVEAEAERIEAEAERVEAEALVAKVKADRAKEKAEHIITLSNAREYYEQAISRELLSAPIPNIGRDDVEPQIRDGALSTNTQVYRTASDVLPDILKDKCKEVRDIIKPVLNSEYVGPDARLIDARLTLRLQGDEEAEKKLRDLLVERDEIASMAHYLLARISRKRGNLEIARGHQKKSSDLFLPSSEAYFDRAVDAGTLQDALDLLSEAIKLDPKHYPSHAMRAWVYYTLREYRYMEHDAVAMTTIGDTDWLGYVLMAMALRESADLKYVPDAVKYHDKSIEFSEKNNDPKLPELYDQRRKTYMRILNYDLALSDAQKLVELQPKNALYHFHVFCALVAQGHYEEAKAKYAIFRPNHTTKGYFRRWSEKYVFNALATGQELNLPADSSREAAFWPMYETTRYYHKLADKAERAVIGGFKATWSPKGAEIAYSRGFPGSNGIEILDLKSGKIRILAVPGKDPAWSPNGQYIAFVSERTLPTLSDFVGEGAQKTFDVNDEEVWIVKPDGSGLRFLAKGGMPSWSRDSKQIYYHSRQDMHLYRLSIEHAEAQPEDVVPCPESYYPVVSQDGKYIAYGAKYESGRCRLEIKELSPPYSTVATWEVPLGEGGLLVQWSPNGRELSVGGFDVSDLGLWIYDLETKSASKVFNGAVTLGTWSPDRTRMAFDLRSPFFEIWIAELEPNATTAESLGRGRNLEEHHNDLIEQYLRAIEANALDAYNIRLVDKLARNLAKRAFEQYQKGAYEDAVGTFTKVNRLTSALGIYWINVASYTARALHQLGQNEQAEAALERLRKRYQGGRNQSLLKYLVQAEKLLAGTDSEVSNIWKCIEKKNLDKASKLLVELKSAPSEDDPYCAGRIQSAYEQLAGAYFQRYLSNKRRTQYDKAIADLMSVIKIDPNHVIAYNSIAWLQATCPEAQSRDGTKAVENATKACELTNWKNLIYLDTLAAAYAEKGDFESAVNWQKKAIDFPPKNKLSELQASFETRLKLYRSNKPYHEGIIGWWKFDGDAIDSSGYEHHGTEVGNPAYGPGISGRALALRGDGDHVLVPDFGAYVNCLDALTVCLWVKSNVTTTDNGFIIFEDPAGPEHPFGGDDNRDMRYDAAGAGGRGTNVIKCAITSNAPTGSVPGRQQLESSSNAQTTQWQHLAMTWSSGDLLRLYINGVEDSPTRREPAKSGVLTGYAKLIIGKGGKDIVTSTSWNGLLDDVRIYSTTLTQKQIKNIILRPDLHAAWDPSPSDGTTPDVEHVKSLAWSPGDNAAQHDVYFGTDKTAVENVDTYETSGIYRGRQTAAGYTPSEPLEWGGGPYYWRIDEYNTDATISKGRVWNFAVADFILVDDFEGYDAGDNQIWFDWRDGLGFGAKGSSRYSAGNGTGSAVGNEFTTTTASFTEETIVHGGKQAIPYLFDNNKKNSLKYSEATLTLSYPRDWTEEDVGILSLWFYGDTSNAAETMYVALNDRAVVTHDNPSAAQIETWTQWKIDLQLFADQGVNLTDVNSIAIGFGDRNPDVSGQPGGSGKMYFDDIRLYRPR